MMLEKITENGPQLTRIVGAGTVLACHDSNDKHETLLSDYIEFPKSPSFGFTSGRNSQNRCHSLWDLLPRLFGIGDRRERFQQIARRSGEPVEPRHHQHVARGKPVDHAA